MATPAIKKKKLSPPSRNDRNKIYAQDIVGHLSQDSSNEESENVRENGDTRNPHTQLEVKRNATSSWSTDTYDSSMFKLKANELLAKVRPDYERRMVNVENSLRKLKEIIERIPNREAKPVWNIALFPI